MVLVPPYHVRLSGAALERLNNVFDEAAPPLLSIPQEYPEFKEQQEEGALRAVRPLLFSKCRILVNDSASKIVLSSIETITNL